MAMRNGILKRLNEFNTNHSIYHYNHHFLTSHVNCIFLKHSLMTITLINLITYPTKYLPYPIDSDLLFSLKPFYIVIVSND